jgi:hypothetical protein
MFNSLMQGFMQGLMAPSPPQQGQGINYQQQQELERQRQEELDRQRKALEEELKRQDEERRRAQELWLLERDKAAATLKGPTPGPLGLKDLGTRDLGIKDITPGKVPNDLSGKVALWKRLQCSAYLSATARKATDPDEAAYLTREAAKALAGEELTVKCPEPSPPPSLYGKGELAKPGPQDQFYSALMQSTKLQLDKLSGLNKEIQDLRAKQQEAQQKVEEKKNELARIRQTPPSEGTGGQTECLACLAEEQLKLAEQDLAQATKGLDDATKMQQEIIKDLNQKRTLYEKVQANPNSANDLLPLAQK